MTVNISALSHTKVTLKKLCFFLMEIGKYGRGNLKATTSLIPVALLTVNLHKFAKWQNIFITLFIYLFIYLFLLLANSVTLATLTHNTETHTTEHMVTLSAAPLRKWHPITSQLHTNRPVIWLCLDISQVSFPHNTPNTFLYVPPEQATNSIHKCYSSLHTE